MPSWNIHMAHVERLVAEESLSELGIRNLNCFLFGNVVPDIYVGYMVPNTSKVLDYRRTHLCDPHEMPEPDHRFFWEHYLQPLVEAGDESSDLARGAWAHLVADAVYNHNVNMWARERKLVFGTTLRERKQADFDLFGHTFDLHLVPEPNRELLEQAAAFPQYCIDEPDVRAACAVASHIVADNRMHALAEPTYDLLDAAFFARVFDEAHAAIASGLKHITADKTPL